MTSRRIGTATNLEDGGTYDFLVMGFPNGFPRGYVSFEIGDLPRRVTGVQKVVQTFLYTLLTNKGSDPIRRRSGTALPEYIFASNIGSDADELRVTVRAQIKDAETQTMKILSSTNNDKASQLASVQMLFVNSEADAITVGLRILTKAGEQASIAVPFPQVDLPINSR